MKLVSKPYEPTNKPFSDFSGRRSKGGGILYGLVLAASVISFSGSGYSDEPIKADVAKTSGCGCCVAWIDHLEKHGFKVSSRNMAMGKLMQFKVANGITPKLASCHTAKISGYTIEGHVPAGDIKRLMTERPDAVGLAVPEMPLGSPGMDFGKEREAYDVFLLREDGSSEIYASYPANQ